MRIDLKNQKGHKVDIDGETWFLVEYPTIEQDMKLKEIGYEVSMIDESLMDIIDNDERARAMNNLPPEKRARILILMEKLYKLAFKYAVKDWNIIDVEGNPVPCKIINNEIDNKLFSLVIQHLTMENLLHIYRCIEFGVTDKKKLSTEDNSITEENLKAEG